jgi:hypothetical protein
MILLAPQGVNERATALLCGRFTVEEEKVGDAAWQPDSPRKLQEQMEAFLAGTKM